MHNGSKIGPVHRRHGVSRFALAAAALVLDLPYGRPLLATALLLATAPDSIAGPPVILPQNGQFVAGAGTITGMGSTLSLNQSSQRAIVNWGSFSIGQGGTVDFNNGTGATLNRVTGTSLSQIMGNLKATGSVYLVNPNGVVVGSSGLVVTNGSFVASTADITDGNFMAGGTLLFKGGTTGTVSNAGTITSSTGDVYLIGANIANSGAITATEGTVGLAAGQSVYLVDGTVQNGSVMVELAAGDISNQGPIRAAQAELIAAGGNIYALAGNDGGLIVATGTSAKGGHIWLSAGGNLTIAGTVSARNADGSGGAIAAVTQGTLDISKATLDASGTTNGGTIETSGHAEIILAGATVEAAAGTGKVGTWTIDPTNLTVDATAAGTIDGSLATTNVTLQTTSTGATGPGNQSSGFGDITIGSTISWSANTTLTLDSYNAVSIASKKMWTLCRTR